MSGKDSGFAIRALPVSAEAREREGGRSVAGVIPYDKMSEDLGGYFEVIRRGAFSQSLKDGDVRCLWGHNTQYVLGRASAGTFRLEDRDDGLHFECSLPSASWAADLYESIKRGDVPGVSFGFYVRKAAWTFEEGKPDLRELWDVDLLEVSVGVAFPAYPDAGANVRALLSDAKIGAGELPLPAKRQGDCNGGVAADSGGSGNAPSETAVNAYGCRGRELDLLEAESMETGDWTNG